MKIIYICGLGHSGSTILDMALGCHSKIIGLGEISNILTATKEELNKETFTRIKCSCGKNMIECEFWSNVRNKILKNQYNSAADRYMDLISVFKNRYGEDKILLDSSKNLNPYLLKLKQQFELKIIFLVRDFRSWSYSINLKQGKNLMFLPLTWAKINFKLLNFLKNNNFDYFTLGYEEFALYPNSILHPLANFLDIDYEDSLLTPGKTKSHIIRGNTLRGDAKKKAAIQYDARWMTSPAINLLASLYFPIFFLNKKYVFSNFIKPRAHAFNKNQDDFLIFSNKKTEALINEGWGKRKK